jgi:hypothetical protein
MRWPPALTRDGAQNEELDLEQLLEGRVWVGDEATRVRRVALHPRLAHNSALLSTQASAVQIWDFASSDVPTFVKRVRISSSLVRACARARVVVLVLDAPLSVCERRC